MTQCSVPSQGKPRESEIRTEIRKFHDLLQNEQRESAAEQYRHLAAKYREWETAGNQSETDLKMLREILSEYSQMNPDAVENRAPVRL